MTQEAKIPAQSEITAGTKLEAENRRELAMLRGDITEETACSCPCICRFRAEYAHQQCRLCRRGYHSRPKP